MDGLVGRGKKVLYITYDGLTDPLGQSQVLPYIFELEKRGYHFTIISFEKEIRFRQESDVIYNLIKDKKIEWVPLKFTSQPPILSKIYDRYLMWHTALRLHQKSKFDLIHCRSYVAAEVGLKLKKQYGTKFLFDMRGFWADEKVDNGQWDLKKPFFKRLYNHYKKKETEFLSNADAVISLTEAAKNYLKGKAEFEKLVIDVIPCCADLEHFDFHKIDSEEVKKLKQKLEIPLECKVLSYIGSVGGWYMIKEMFEFFRLLLSKDASWYFLILSKDNPSKIMQEALALSVPEKKVRITYAERSILPTYMAISSFSIFFIRNTFSKTASSPTKHAELMGMGIPVICNSIGDTGNIVTATNTGLLVDSFDEGSMISVIKKMNQLETISSDSIRSCALEYFNLQNGAAKYAEVYLRTLQQAPSSKFINAA